MSGGPTRRATPGPVMAPRATMLPAFSALPAALLNERDLGLVQRLNERPKGGFAGSCGRGNNTRHSQCCANDEDIAHIDLHAMI